MKLVQLVSGSEGQHQIEVPQIKKVTKKNPERRCIQRIYATAGNITNKKDDSLHCETATRTQNKHNQFRSN